MKRVRPSSGKRRPRNTYITKSGQTIKVNRSLKERLHASRDARAARKAQRLVGLPKSRFKRLLYHLQPKRIYHYWFSRDGVIMALKITGIGIVASFILLVGLFAYFRKDLPNINDISGNNIGGSVLYYDRSGQNLLWEDVDGVKRIPIKDADISNYVKQATVAIEDKDFFKHGGFDVRGIARAGINDLTNRGGGRQGGSTITQQLVRLTQEGVGRQQTITRKIKELVLAVELERSYNKQEILTGYLNTAPYGGIEYGVEAAAQNYFNKGAKDLTLDESAMLAAIPKSPSLYSKYSDYFDKAEMVGRQHYIIDQMTDQGMIKKEEAEAAKKIDTITKIKDRPTHYAGIKAPYFVLAAKNELENQFGNATVRRGGWKVITTLDMTLQKKAEEVIANNVKNASGKRADVQAFVAEDVETGQIVSLVGGTDFNNAQYGKINYAHNAFIPPGSSFKPYDYAAFIDNNTNVGAGSVLYDSNVALPGYPCTNKGSPPPRGGGNCLQDYDFKTPGPITLRYALGGSRNIPAVKAMLSAVPNDKSNGRVDSINKTIQTANALMSNPNNPNTYKCYNPGADINTATQDDVTQCYGASAIGDGAFLHLDDHVNGFASLSRLGKAIPRTYILKISDAGGKTINQFTQPKGKQVIRQDSAYIVTDMASDPNASYLPAGFYKYHRQKNGWNFAIKTGTTNNGFDGLMASWSTKYAAVAWVGNHTRNVALTSTMEVITTPIVKGWMEAAHANLKPVNWAKPSGIKTMPAFVVRTHVGVGSIEPSIANDIFPSWYVAKSAAAANQTIDTVSNKLATSCTPEKAKKQVSGGDALTFSVDVFVTGFASDDTSTSDDIHKCDDVKPSVTLDSASPSSISVTVSQGTHALSSDTNKGTLNIIIDGQIVQSFSIDSAGAKTLSYTYSGAGSKAVTAQIVDSVLYEDTSEPVTVNFSASASAATLTLSAEKTSGNNYKFTWNSVSGASSYKLCTSTNGGAFSCADFSSGDTKSVSGSNKKAYVTSNNSVTSTTISL